LGGGSLWGCMRWGFVLFAGVRGQHIPNRTFLELPFLEEIGEAICFPERDAVTSGEGEVELAIGVCDEGIGCCLGRDVQACAVVVWLLHFG
jgi:hypothetical protein